MRFALSIIALALVGCSQGKLSDLPSNSPSESAGDSSKKPAGGGTPPKTKLDDGEDNPSVPTHFSYSVDSPAAEGRLACSTGPQSFATLEAMCFGLQNPELNKNDCGREERHEIFQKRCADTRYSWNEALSCQVVLLKNKNRELSFSSSYVEEDVLSKQNLCTGPDKESLEEVGDTRHEATMSGDVGLQAELRFVPRREATATKQSYIRMRIASQGADLMHPVEYNGDGISSISGVTLDRYFKYSISCKHTWACDAAPKNPAEKE